MSRSEAVIEPA